MNRIACCLLQTVLVSLIAQAETQDVVVDPTAEVAGKQLIQYTTLWWQWANRVSDGVKPFQDPTGEQCGLNQSGDIWFLAGTDGTDDVIRHCSMPPGKYVFLPIINMIEHSIPGTALTCDQAKAAVAANNDHLAQAEVTIDGVAVENIDRYRIRSEQCFDAYSLAPYLKKTESYYPAATDGYWLMLKPFPLGLHHISVKARYDNPGSKLGDLDQTFEYELKVEEKKEKKQAKPVPQFDSILVSIRHPCVACNT